MILAGAVGRLFFAVLGCLLLSACFQVPENSLEEEREPNFLDGRNRVTAHDYTGAMESFEKALQANPRSAAAHFDLGVITEDPGRDYAAAIYHYQRFLNLRPDDPRAGVVRQRINGCKIELAKGVPFGAISREMQLEVEKLTAANTALRQQVDSLKEQLAQHPFVVTQFVTNVFASVPAPNTSSSPRVQPSPASIRTPPAQPTSHPRSSEQARPLTPTPVSRSIAYKVRPNDTVASIARLYGVSTQSILSANRGLDPRRLRSGQIITIPKG
ncbi:MAG: LysM peptidoglycan-binding protein [Verrucomicrobiales bacterium]|nr:LysM peptidoglycan-binding protein [Verrucomicrobiales bacterium]